jgi:competence protein ComEC
LLTILRLFRVRRIPALFVAAAVAWLYAVISGFTAPVVRAAGGFTLFLAASYCFRRTRILNVLALVGIVYLLLDPEQLFDPSFQLSFLSAAAIAVFAIPLMDRFTVPIREGVKRFDQPSYDPQVEFRAAQWRVELRLFAETLQSWTGLPTRWAQWTVANAARLMAFLADAVAISACVQFGLALPMVSYFHRISMTGLTANAIVVPLLSLVVPLGFASILTGWQALAAPTTFLLRAAELVAGWHMHFEPSWRMGAVPVWAALGFSIALIALAVAIRFGKRPAIWAALAASLCLFAVVAVQPWRPLLRPGLLEVTAIDVSQGESVLVAFPNGETMLIDAGGFPGMERMARKPQIDMGEDVVSPYLWSRRIRRLDYAALTHGHSDHMAGLPAILDNFAPRKLWTGAEPDSPAWRIVREHAAGSRTTITALHRGAPDWYIGGVRLRVLAPSPDYVPGDAAGNNDSLVLELQYRKHSILLPGDAEKPVEDDLLTSGMLHRVTLLKVGHHGSRTSSSEPFLAALSPQLAIISDGYNNQFHHPHGIVLDRLAEHRTAVFRTDQRGLVTFLTDGDRVEIHSFR